MNGIVTILMDMMMFDVSDGNGGDVKDDDDYLQ